MVLRSILSVTAIFLAVSSVQAGRNDWSKACHSGECSYDIKGQTSGSISIAGSPHAISDITSAGGWAIVDCNPDTRIQDIRVVCSNPKCNHLYNGHGAVNTIVRLPENCTDAPFARVAKEWKHSNQSIPDHIAAKITKRELAASVRGLTLDTNFSAVDANVTGDVTFSIEGTSQSGDSGNFTVTPAISSRGFFSSLNTIHFDKSAAFPIKFDKSATLFDQSISCPQNGNIPAFNGDLKIVGETLADASLSFAVAAAGKIIPPKLTDFGLVAQVDGKIDGVITVNASAAGTITIAKKTLLSVGVPGLSVAGVLDIGPAFEVSALGNANLDAQANFGVTLAYNVDGAKLTFPPSVGSSSGSFSPGDMSVSVAATPNVAVDGDIEAHLIPAATFGINAFDGDAQANINLSLDTSGKLTLSLKAGSLDTGSTGTSGKSGSASGSFSGCAEIDAGLAVTGGADAHLFDIFDKSASVTLFQKNFNVLDKCFGGSGSTKRDSFAKKRKHVRDISKRGLTCPSVAGAVANVASQVVSSADISPE